VLRRGAWGQGVFGQPHGLRTTELDRLFVLSCFEIAVKTSASCRQAIASGSRVRPISSTQVARMRSSTHPAYAAAYFGAATGRSAAFNKAYERSRTLRRRQLALAG